MIRTVVRFIQRVQELKDVSDAYDLFEDECTDALRDKIYDLADPASPEPFRSAMTKLGFVNY